MVFILGLIARLSIIAFFGGIIFFSISDIVMNTTYLADLDNFVNLGDDRVGALLAVLSLIYLIVFLLSYINKWTKYSQNRKIKDKNSEIEVTIKTINEVSKDFLAYQKLIKNVKVKSYPKGKMGVVIEGFIDTYNVENLSERLLKIQDELSQYVEKSTGIKVKKTTLKVKKILQEPFTEEKIEVVEEVEEIKEVNNEKEGN